MDETHGQFETGVDCTPMFPVQFEQSVPLRNPAPFDQADRKIHRPVLGAIDWELLFEQPNFGYLALIEVTESSQTLRTATTLVLRMLYRRESDGAAFARLTGRLSRLIPDELDHEELRQAKQIVVKNLRIVKKHRIHPKRPQWYLN